MLWILAAVAAPETTTVEDQASFEPWAAGVRPMPVINGRVEPEFPSVMAISVGPFDICTGNLITPRVLLAAAHCGAGLPTETVAQFGTAVFGQSTEAPLVTQSFSEAAYHPGYIPLESGATLGEFDLAIAVLAEPASARPTRFRMEPLDDSDVGTELISVGYGVDENGDNGTKRSATVFASQIDGMFIVSETSDNPGDANICSGDSGGPQFAIENGELVQWGVHSWADSQCSFRSGSTRTDVAADWILDQVEAVHGSRDLCEINGRYADGHCDSDCPLVDGDCVFTFATPADTASPAASCSVGLNRFCAPWWSGFQVLSRRR